MWFWYDMNDMCDIVYTYAPTQSQQFCSTIQFIWLLLDAWFSIFKLNSSTSGMNACCTLTRESLLLQLQNFITMSSSLFLSRNGCRYGANCHAYAAHEWIMMDGRELWERERKNVNRKTLEQRQKLLWNWEKKWDFWERKEIENQINIRIDF